MALFHHKALSHENDPVCNIAGKLNFMGDDYHCPALLRQFAHDIEDFTDKFGVNSTPTLFINGKKQVGGVSIEDLAKVIDPLVTKS